MRHFTFFLFLFFLGISSSAATFFNGTDWKLAVTQLDPSTGLTYYQYSNDPTADFYSQIQIAVISDKPAYLTNGNFTFNLLPNDGPIFSLYTTITLIQKSTLTFTFAASSIEGLRCGGSTGEFSYTRTIPITSNPFTIVAHNILSAPDAVADNSIVCYSTSGLPIQLAILSASISTNGTDNNFSLGDTVTVSQGGASIVDSSNIPLTLNGSPQNTNSPYCPTCGQPVNLATGTM